MKVSGRIHLDDTYQWFETNEIRYSVAQARIYRYNLSWTLWFLFSIYQTLRRRQISQEEKKIIWVQGLLHFWIARMITYIHAKLPTFESRRVSGFGRLGTSVSYLLCPAFPLLKVIFLKSRVVEWLGGYQISILN